ncbi:hypothetical protein [Pelosinus sp. UFO1]|uniref:hypothetical protein n=1 Tax=Pelosinus sp. UFO1 TaxID=484770 RepID=UPI0004D1AEA5|nr:hypothetical protein [Pelosinus sp. UFO1]AIF51239.1 hypothetical protein UFO1_1688 [Pelosinus sp. UFO1]
MGNRIAVVTIAVEFKNGHNYTDAINEIGQKKNKFSLPPIDIKRTERFHVFDGLGFDSGIKATLNLFFKDNGNGGSVAVHLPNIQHELENLESKTYNLIAISESLFWYHTYDTNR